MYEWPLRLNWAACLPLFLLLVMVGLVALRLLYSGWASLCAVTIILGVLLGGLEWRWLTRRYQGRLVFFASPQDVDHHTSIRTNQIGWYWVTRTPVSTESIDDDATSDPRDVEVLPLRLLSARLTHEQFVALTFCHRTHPSPFSRPFSLFYLSFLFHTAFLFRRQYLFCVTSNCVAAGRYRCLRRLILTRQGLV